MLMRSLFWLLPCASAYISVSSVVSGELNTEKGQHMAWTSRELQALNKSLSRWASPAVYEELKGKSRPPKLKTVLPRHPGNGEVPETSGTPPPTSKPWPSPEEAGAKFKGGD